MTFVLLVAVMPCVATSAYAQPPAPPAENPPPSEQAPPPPDDGPKPAGVGTSQPPPDDTVAPEELELFPATSFPGVPLSGTAPSARPYSGLFGGAQPSARQKHSLSLTGSLFAGYSTNVVPLSDNSGVPEPLAGQASMLAGGSGSVNYTRSWTSAAVGAHLNGSRTWVETYPDDPWVTRWDVGASGGFSRNLGRRVRFNARGSAGYSPYLSLGMPDFTAGGTGNLPIGGAGLDNALVRDPSVFTTAGASLAYSLNRKSSLEAYYDATRQTFVSSDSQNFDRVDQLVGGRYRYQFSRFAGVRAGYGHRRASLGGPDASPYSNHIIDVGVDAGYGRSYALTRRTTFSFSTDSSLFVDETSGGKGDDSFDPQTRVFVGGSADLTHSMGRTWMSRAGYRRAVSYQAGFDQPLLSDTAFGSLGGLVAPRIDFQATAQYTSGSVGFSGANNGYGMSSATASLRGAITRNLAAYAQYFYYHYQFEDGVGRPAYLQSNLDRQGATVGLTAWLPLIGSRGRR